MIIKNKDRLQIIEEFLIKVSEMYNYNLKQYPEENPTMLNAFQEIIEEYRELPNEE